MGRPVDTSSIHGPRVRSVCPARQESQAAALWCGSPLPTSAAGTGGAGQREGGVAALEHQRCRGGDGCDARGAHPRLVGLVAQGGVQAELAGAAQGQGGGGQGQHGWLLIAAGLGEKAVDALLCVNTHWDLGVGVRCRGRR